MATGSADQMDVRRATIQEQEQEHVRRTLSSWRGGYTLIEMLIVLVIVASLAAVAYPSYQLQLLRSRRAEALEQITLVQQAQERWRGDHASYATLAELGLNAAGGSASAAAGTNRFFEVSVVANSPTSYELRATAKGSQTADASCGFIRLTVTDGNSVMSSGPIEGAANLEPANRRCWNS